MSNAFFEHPILNSPYAYPQRHWELEINHMRRHSIHFVIDRVQFGAYASVHIRPLAVSPLTHPESVPNPWGFSFSGLPRSVSRQEGWQ